MGGLFSHKMPAMPAIPGAVAPVTQSSKEVVQAAQDVAGQELLKKSIRKTIYAGDTGGFKGPTIAGAVSPQGQPKV